MKYFIIYVPVTFYILYNFIKVLKKGGNVPPRAVLCVFYVPQCKRNIFAAQRSQLFFYIFHYFTFYYEYNMLSPLEVLYYLLDIIY